MRYYCEKDLSHIMQLALLGVWVLLKLYNKESHWYQQWNPLS